jgi:hypothetical protein
VKEGVEMSWLSAPSARSRVIRARWRPVLLVTGALLAVIGVLLPSGWAFVPGLLVLLVAVLTEAEPSPCQAAAQMTAAHWSG